MKNLLIIFLSFISLVLNAQSGGINENQLFEKNGYAVTYPKTWALSQDIIPGVEFILQSPIESANDRFSESLNLTIQDFTPTGQQVNVKMMAEMYEVQLRNMISEYKQISFNAIKYNEMDAWELVCTGKQEGFELKWRNLCFVKDNKGYIFTFTASPDGYERLEETAKNIINSLTFKD